MDRASIIACNDLPAEKVDCPEWGGPVWIRTMCGTERDAFDVASVTKKGGKRDVNLHNLRARLIVLTACKEDGSPLFLPTDVDNVGSKSAKVLDRLFDVARRLNGLGEQEIEELAKN